MTMNPPSGWSRSQMFKPHFIDVTGKQMLEDTGETKLPGTCRFRSVINLEPDREPVRRPLRRHHPHPAVFFKVLSR